MPFRLVHGVVRELASYADSKDGALNFLSLEEMKTFCPFFSADMGKIFDPWLSIKNKKTSGSANLEEVKKQIELVRRLFDQS